MRVRDKRHSPGMFGTCALANTTFSIVYAIYTHTRTHTHILKRYWFWHFFSLLLISHAHMHTWMSAGVSDKFESARARRIFPHSFAHYTLNTPTGSFESKRYFSSAYASKTPYTCAYARERERIFFPVSVLRKHKKKCEMEFFEMIKAEKCNYQLIQETDDGTAFEHILNLQLKQAAACTFRWDLSSNSNADQKICWKPAKSTYKIKVAKNQTLTCHDWMKLKRMLGFCIAILSAATLPDSDDSLLAAWLCTLIGVDLQNVFLNEWKKSRKLIGSRSS